MEENNYLIYFLILLCICLILFYLFYKLNNKVNVSNQKLDTLDKFLSGVLLNKVVPQPEKLDKEKLDKEKLDKKKSDIVQLKKDLSDEEEPDEELYEEPDEDQFEKDDKKIGKKSNLDKIKEEDSD